MANIKVKICGITNQQDASKAVEYGADAIGFIFAKSPRRVSRGVAKRIARSLPPFISRVGVFVNSPIKSVLKAVEDCDLDVVQLHGDETPAYCKKIKSCKVIKVFHVTSELTAKDINRYSISACMLETLSNKRGGSGKIWNWSLIKRFKKVKSPIIITGGLTHQNIKKAIKITKPYAVDVSSGVEVRPGKKDNVKMKKFVKSVHND